MSNVESPKATDVIEFDIPRRKRRKNDCSSDEKVSGLSNRHLSTDETVGIPHRLRGEKDIISPPGDTSNSARRSHTRVSGLERLPVELLEEVLWHSLEVSLPRASPFLGKMLAKEYVYGSLIRAAWLNSASENYAERIAPARPIIRTWMQGVRLREDLLACRWCTLDRIAEHSGWVLPSSLCAVDLAIWHPLTPTWKFSSQSSQLINSDAKGRRRATSKSQTRNSYSSGRRLNRVTKSELDRRAACYVCSSGRPSFHQNVLNEVYVPDRVVNPESWRCPSVNCDHDRSCPVYFLLYLLLEYCKFIKAMRSCGCPARSSLLRVKTEAVWLGIETAIREGNSEVLSVLCWSLTMSSPGQPVEPGQVIGNPALVFPSKLIRLAVKQGEKASPLIHCIVGNGIVANASDIAGENKRLLMKWAAEVVHTGTRQNKKIAQRVLDLT